MLLASVLPLSEYTHTYVSVNLHDSELCFPPTTYSETLSPKPQHSPCAYGYVSFMDPAGKNIS